jgi:Sigma-70, region 4
MGQEALGRERGELDDFIQAFETARAQAPQADLTAFLPDADHPLYRRVLRELIRVDLEYGWERDRPKSLDEYRQLFPELFRDPENVHEIAFEEYRLRQQAGQNPDPAEYAQRFAIGTENWANAGPAASERVSDSPVNGLAKALSGLVGLIPNSAVIAEALEKLPSHQKVVFELRVQGCEVAEIAVKVGRSRRTVERIIQEIINHLIALLSERD